MMSGVSLQQVVGLFKIVYLQKVMTGCDDHILCEINTKAVHRAGRVQEFNLYSVMRLK